MTEKAMCLDREKNLLFCQQASEYYMRLLEEAGGDPRVAAGLQALRDLERSRGWMPTIDARDARRIMRE